MFMWQPRWRGLGENDTCICMAESSAVHLKSTQHCSSAIPQYKQKLRKKNLFSWVRFTWGLLSVVLQTANFAISSQNRESLIWTLAFGNRDCWEECWDSWDGKDTDGNVVGQGEGLEADPRRERLQGGVRAVKSLDLLGNCLPWGTKHCILGVFSHHSGPHGIAFMEEESLGTKWKKNCLWRTV